MKKEKDNLRDTISKIFIKWGLPTRQIVITELCHLVMAEAEEAFRAGCEKADG